MGAKTKVLLYYFVQYTVYTVYILAYLCYLVQSSYYVPAKIAEYVLVIAVLWENLSVLDLVHTASLNAQIRFFSTAISLMCEPYTALK